MRYRQAAPTMAASAMVVWRRYAADAPTQVIAAPAAAMIHAVAMVVFQSYFA